MSELNTIFHPIDFAAWDRQQYFYYFTKMLPTGFSLTVEVDVTETRKAMKAINKPFMAAYLYIVCTQLAAQQEMRITTVDGKLGYFDVLHPSYAVFHEDDKTISNMWTEYSASFAEFFCHYEYDQSHFAKNHGPMAKPVASPPNLCMTGMLPWISFTHYSPIPYTQSDCFFPVLEAGKFFERNERLIMPVSLMVQHAVADGYHASVLLDHIQEAFAHPEAWIDL